MKYLDYDFLLGLEQHLKIVGMSGSGKSKFMIGAIAHLADTEEVGLGCFFPHAKEGHELLVHLRDRGHLDRTVVDDLGDNVRVLPKVYLRVSTHPDPFERAAENEEFRDGFLSMPARRRDMDKVANTPAIEKYSHVAATAYQYLDEWLPQYLMAKMLVREHPIQDWALQHVTDDEARWELQQVANMGTHDWVALAQPAVRFLEGFLLRTHIKLRTSVRSTFDLPAHLKDCGDGRPGIYVSLGGGSKEATAVNQASDFQQIAFDAKHNRSDVRREVWRDEVTNFGLFGPFEAENVATLRGFKVFMRDALQSYNYATPEIEDAHRTNSGSVIFKQGSERMGKETVGDLMSMLNKYDVHHTERTTKQRTKHRSEVRKSVGKWKGPNDAEGTSENESVFLVPEVEEYEETRDVYSQSNEQVFWSAQGLRELSAGQCWVQAGNRKPVNRQVRLLPDLFPFAEDFPFEVDECLREIKDRPIYVRPQTYVLPETPPPAKAAPRPRANPKPKGSPGKKGTRS